MFTDAYYESSEEGSVKKDDDGAKRVFFGGERFIEGVSGEAYVMQLTVDWFSLFNYIARICKGIVSIAYNKLLSDENQITIQRTELNTALGLEVQLHVTEAVCPALSEPGKLMGLQHTCFMLASTLVNILNDPMSRIAGSSTVLDWIICLFK